VNGAGSGLPHVYNGSHAGTHDDMQGVRGARPQRRPPFDTSRQAGHLARLHLHGVRHGLPGSDPVAQPL